MLAKNGFYTVAATFEIPKKYVYMFRPTWIIGFMTLVLTSILFSCEEEFIPDVVISPSDIVVEGYIEAGEGATPPFIILTRSLPFFQELDSNQLNNAFVHDAVITVKDGDRSVQLSELCLDDIPEEFREQATQLLGVNPDSVGFNFCIYIDLSLSMMGEEGHTYELEIEVEGKSLRAVTYIPFHVPLDELTFQDPPGEPNDTLRQLLIKLTDPSNQADYYRYQTGRNAGPLRYPAGGSVVDDRLFDGQDLEIPLTEAEPPGQNFDLDTYGLFTRGDVIVIKWITIDEAHYDFINTLEFATANQGPFSNYTRVQHNVEGGLGIWGGLSASYYELFVP